jgi:hypothetical protein
MLEKGKGTLNKTHSFYMFLIYFNDDDEDAVCTQIQYISNIVHPSVHMVLLHVVEPYK